MNETFNAEAAKTAINNAKAEIEELVNNFKNTQQNVEENFAANAGSSAALGGAAGALSQSAFTNENAATFSSLSANIDNFVNNKLATVIANSSATQSETASIYNN